MRRLVAATSIGGVGLVVAWMAWHSGWVPGFGRQGPRSVLLISIDTLRADHLGSYGYTAAATPVLDALAARGLRFAAGRDRRAAHAAGPHVAHDRHVPGLPRRARQRQLLRRTTSSRRWPRRCRRAAIARADSSARSCSIAAGASRRDSITTSTTSICRKFEMSRRARRGPAARQRGRRSRAGLARRGSRRSRFSRGCISTIRTARTRRPSRIARAFRRRAGRLRRRDRRDRRAGRPAAASISTSGRPPRQHRRCRRRRSRRIARRARRAAARLLRLRRGGAHSADRRRALTCPARVVPDQVRIVDVMPTILELVGVEAPAAVQGVEPDAARSRRAAGSAGASARPGIRAITTAGAS